MAPEECEPPLVNDLLCRLRRSLTDRSEGWLGRRDSNPDSAVQSRVSYH